MPPIATLASGAMPVSAATTATQSAPPQLAARPSSVMPPERPAASGRSVSDRNRRSAREHADLGSPRVGRCRCEGSGECRGERRAANAIRQARRVRRRRRWRAPATRCARRCARRSTARLRDAPMRESSVEGMKKAKSTAAAGHPPLAEDRRPYRKRRNRAAE